MWATSDAILILVFLIRHVTRGAFLIRLMTCIRPLLRLIKRFPPIFVISRLSNMSVGQQLIWVDLEVRVCAYRLAKHSFPVGGGLASNLWVLDFCPANALRYNAYFTGLHVQVCCKYLFVFMLSVSPHLIWTMTDDRYVKSYICRAVCSCLHLPCKCYEVFSPLISTCRVIRVKCGSGPNHGNVLHRNRQRPEHSGRGECMQH